MLQKIEQIKKALEYELYLPALALALTLPDICGQVHRPDLKGARYVGKRYKVWFNDCAEKYLQNYYSKLNDNDIGYIKPNLLNADLCYALRCDFLHSGEFNQDTILKKLNDDNPEKTQQYIFKLYVGGMDICTTLKNNDSVKVIGFNIDNLCAKLCYCATKYYEEVGGKGFENTHIEYINQTDKVIEFLRNMGEKMKDFPPPAWTENKSPKEIMEMVENNRKNRLAMEASNKTEPVGLVEDLDEIAKNITIPDSQSKKTE